MQEQVLVNFDRLCSQHFSVAVCSDWDTNLLSLRSPLIKFPTAFFYFIHMCLSRKIKYSSQLRCGLFKFGLYTNNTGRNSQVFIMRILSFHFNCYGAAFWMVSLKTVWFVIIHLPAIARTSFDPSSNSAPTCENLANWSCRVGANPSRLHAIFCKHRIGGLRVYLLYFPWRMSKIDRHI